MALLNKCDTCGKAPKKGFPKIQIVHYDGVYMFCSDVCEEKFIHASQLKSKYGIKNEFIK